MSQWSLEELFAAWVAASLVIVSFRLRQSAGVGLVIAYLLNLWAYHGVAGLNLLPWFSSTEIEFVEIGFPQATVLLAGVTVGTLLAPSVARLFQSPPTSPILLAPEPKLARCYMAIGLLCVLFLVPFATRVASAAAIVGGGWRLLLVGFCLVIWDAWRRGRPAAMMGWLMACYFGLPLMTLLAHGFLGFGASAALAVLVFTGSLVRSRWKVLVAGALLGYLGLSAYVTYMRDREELREVVWTGGRVADRVSELTRSVQTFEWFTPRDEEHLRRLDSRLNQNMLVGAAIQQMDAGLVPYARGKTIWQAMLALVPRALWPSKPFTVGGNELASEYTGLIFDESTSVGIGQVMELYINFGTPGIFLGGLLLAFCLTLIDASATRHLQRGDWQRFAYWYVPGLSFLEAGGQFFQLTANAAAGVLAAHLVNRVLLHRLRGRRLALEEAESGVGQSERVA